MTPGGGEHAKPIFNGRLPLLAADTERSEECRLPHLETSSQHPSNVSCLAVLHYSYGPLVARGCPVFSEAKSLADLAIETIVWAFGI